MRKALPFVVLIVIVIAGCKGKLELVEDVQLEAGLSQYRMIEAISSEQKINVSAKATNGVFSIYVFLEKDKAAVDTEIMQGKPGAKVLAHKQKVSDAELQVTVPAKEACTVMLTSADGKKAEVKLKITN